MLNERYSEKQMTRWISANTPPVRDGRYQIMTLGSLATFDAWYQGEIGRFGSAINGVALN